jgi:hypothetical protein
MGQFVRSHFREDVYFGVAARQDKTSGRLKNCANIRCLFADLDFKQFESEEDAWQALENFPLKPSLLVRSGGGLHCYWLLAEPINLRNQAEECKMLLRAIAQVL